MKKSKLLIITCAIAKMLWLSVFAFAFIVWFDTFDVTGLEFYNNEPISEFYPAGEGFYLITENGKLYVVGSYGDTEDRRYRNSEFYFNEKIGLNDPVLVFNKKVEMVIPYREL